MRKIEENTMTNEEMMTTVAVGLDNILVKLSDYYQDMSLNGRHSLEGRKLGLILGILASTFDITEFRDNADAMREIASELKTYAMNCENVANAMEGK